MADSGGGGDSKVLSELRHGGKCGLEVGKPYRFGHDRHLRCPMPMVDPDLVRAPQLRIEPRHVGNRAWIDRGDEGQAQVTRHGAVIGGLVDLAAVEQLSLETGAVATRPIGKCREQWLREAERRKGDEFRVLGRGAMICRQVYGRGGLKPRIVLHRQRCWRIFP
jgi:hypothetical protein